MLSYKLIEKEWRKLVKRMGLKQVVKAARKDYLGSLMETRYNQEEITLHYTPFSLEFFSNLSELRVALKHEVSHVLSSPTSKISLPVTLTGFSKEYIDILREYLAHQEFIKRFPNDRKGFLRFAKRIFQPDNILADLLVAYQSAGAQEAMLNFFGAIFRIYYDSVYFALVSDGTFFNWCKSGRVEGLYQLFLYIMEDVKFIDAENIGYDEKINLMLESLKIVVLVDIETMKKKGQISLLKDPNEMGYTDVRVASWWESRMLPLWSRPS